MRSEARLAYRKARTLFFRDSEFTQIDKLNAAKQLRTRIRELADCGADSTEIANTAGSEVRQDLQIGALFETSMNESDIAPRRSTFKTMARRL